MSRFLAAILTQAKTSLGGSSRMGKAAIAICTYTASYMVANYTETQLTQIALQFHTTKQFPIQIKKAYGSCLNK